MPPLCLLIPVYNIFNCLKDRFLQILKICQEKNYPECGNSKKLTFGVTAGIITPAPLESGSIHNIDVFTPFFKKGHQPAGGYNPDFFTKPLLKRANKTIAHIHKLI